MGLIVLYSVAAEACITGILGIIACMQHDRTSRCANEWVLTGWMLGFAGLGRRSLLPSIPETILNSSDPADSPARRKAVEASILPQASEVLPEISGGSFEASASIPAMRRALSDSHPFLSRSVDPDAEEAPLTPREAGTHPAATANDGTPPVATSPFQAAAGSSPRGDPAGQAHSLDTEPASLTAVPAMDAEASPDNGAAKETSLEVVPDKAAAEPNPSAQAEEQAVGEITDGDLAARAALEVKLRGPALATRQSSGLDATNSRAGSLDLGMLPPREMQVCPSQCSCILGYVARYTHAAAWQHLQVSNSF